MRMANIEKLAEALIDEFKDLDDPSEINFDDIAQVVARKCPEASVGDVQIALTRAIAKLQAMRSKGNA
jgi:hypothetical protein